jgi:uncharacterized protein (DUF58 family)
MTSLTVTPSRRGLWIATYAVVLVLLVAVIGWVSTHPEPLPTTETRVTASTPVTEPVYLGVFGTGADFDRTLHIAGVRVFASSTVDVTVTPHVCHGGSVRVTTTPETFCEELGPTEDATLGSGDTIVLEVVGEEPGVVAIDRIRIAYRGGMQWATQDAGAPSQVTILAR